MAFNEKGLISNLDALDAKDGDFGTLWGSSAQTVIDHYRYWLTGKGTAPEGYIDLYGTDKYEAIPEFTPSISWEDYLKQEGYESTIKYKSHMYYSYYNAYKLVNTVEEAYDPEVTYYADSDA